jgi:hypothetical protein
MVVQGARGKGRAMTTRDGNVVWRTSSYCESGACIEVAVLDDRIRVRHSVDIDGGDLIFSRDEWQAFLDGVRAGDFDLPR